MLQRAVTSSFCRILVAPALWQSPALACSFSSEVQPDVQQVADRLNSSNTAGTSSGSPADHESSSSPVVDFGFQTVAKHEKAKRVAEVFTSVARSYDVMNDLMSMGLHHQWKAWLVDELRPFSGQQHLDMAGGTGDVAFRVLAGIQAAEAVLPPPASRPAGHVTVLDINPDMLAEGRRRAAAVAGSEARLTWVEGDAERLPFEDGCFDTYTVAFGIRNVTNRDAALREAFRVLRPGGRFICLEFAQVTDPLLRAVYDAYSFNVIPRIGQLVANDAGSYQYLVESIRMFPTQDSFASMIEAAGFSQVSYQNFTGGIVALHSGFKLS